MALTIVLFKVLKYALKIHSASEDSDHSLKYSRNCSTNIDNPIIRALVQKQFEIIAKIYALRMELFP